ncbi:hypothetical protein [Photobacterium sanguinicancri]|uniref:Uncharacterized protein n=1 Tax=Photobacterium sanguinicancri TaxID=875932 RepID=A0ABX4FV71_9GAMM|nr:hypothetical protein [Photobacterium sanguinicancri]OZS42677.1 hypothetical protein ASV53_17165 [Photobacterium sanguinicancri]
MKLKEALVAKGVMSIVVMTINILINAIILIFAWNSLLSSVHPGLPEFSFLNAIGIVLVTCAIQGKFSLQVSIK